MHAANRLSGETTSVECPGDGRDRGRRTDGACAIAIMAKASAPGRTKTRLVPPLTFEQAAALNTTFLQDIAGNLLVGRELRRDRRLRRFRSGRHRGVFPRRLAIGHRLDRCVPAQSRRLFGAHDQRNICARTCRSGRPQFRQSDIADCALDRNRQHVGATRRARRSRSLHGRRLLSSWTEDPPSPFVRGHHLGHRTGRRADPGTGARSKARRAPAATLVRCRRRGRPAPAAR